MIRKRTCEAEIVGSNPGNGKKSHARIFAQKIAQARWEKENIFLIFIHAANIYFNTQKNGVRHLCVDIGDGLRIP